MNTPSKALVVLTALFAGMANAGAATPDDRGYGFIDAFIVHHEERLPERERSWGGRLGLGIVTSARPGGRTSLELGFFNGPIRRERAPDERQNGLMLNLVNSWDLGMVDPYVSLGAGGVLEYQDLAWAAELGAGTLVNLSRELDLRIGVSAMNVYNGHLRADKSEFMDYRAIVGLAVPFGQTAPPPPPPVIDSDGDGLPDSQDRCPTQAAPTPDGCPAPVVPAAPPRDTDGDGIDDAQDECPGTLGGLQVDGSGCIIVTATAAPQQVVLKGVTFVSGSAQLAPNAKTVLDVAYDALAGQANLRVELGGHTDSVGSDALNQSLSQRRAESVRKYLVDKGIAADRVSAKGYGESQPIADNKTKEGRQENRRVVFKILN